MEITADITTKVCSACGECKPASDYYRDANKRDGLYARCKPCWSAYAMEWRRRNPLPPKSPCTRCGKAEFGAKKRKHADVCPACRVELGVKVCHDCGERKPLNEYHQAKHRSDGASSRCKTCTLTASNEARWRKRYGLTPDEYAAMMSDPCRICGAPSKHLDHDHVTGRARAALCHGCNMGLGFFKDDPALMRAAAEYIELYQEVAA